MKFILFISAIVFLTSASFGYSDSTGTIFKTSLFTGAKFYNAKDFIRYSTFRNDHKESRPFNIVFNQGIGRAKAINENIVIGALGSLTFLQTREDIEVGFGLEAGIFKIGDFCRDFPKFPFVIVSLSKGLYPNRLNLQKSLTIGIHNFAHSYHTEAIHPLAFGFTISHVDFLYFGISSQLSLNFSKMIKARRNRKGKNSK